MEEKRKQKNCYKESKRDRDSERDRRKTESKREPESRKKRGTKWRSSNTRKTKLEVRNVLRPH